MKNKRLSKTEKIVVEYLVNHKGWATRIDIARAFNNTGFSSNISTVASLMKRLHCKVGYGLVIRRVSGNRQQYRYKICINRLINAGFLLKRHSCYYSFDIDLYAADDEGISQVAPLNRRECKAVQIIESPSQAAYPTIFEYGIM